ncbi:ABC transporter substrate-binding protein [Fusibacter paucivorans]|uniref:ABC transporter substrate-binding protein n=1 Tax=Fusibacter paucivorans TaxID=76009 RepID=A0ABS5PJR4_9FIRM|nr:ABC transporter substrate-binding protein [Fusibacter paucivorans]MBS7525384.1 ABC transporter substrate-binding protein [Fusibacter paucivorans]
MKKTMFSVALVLVLIFGMTGCGAKSETPVPESSPAENTPAESTPAESDAAQSESASNETSASSEGDDSYYPVTVTTYTYAKEPIEVTFEKAPEKVFAVYQDSIETLLALGLEERIVAGAGLDQDVKADYQSAFEKVNYLTEFTPDKESVIMLEPDFILSWYSYFSDKRLGEVTYWHDRDIQTYIMLNSGCAPERVLENEYTDILNLGIIFNVTDKAEAIVAEMREAVEQVAKKAGEMDVKPSVLLMEVEKDGIRVYGDNTLGGDMIKQLGADLVVAPENHMSSEDLIETNPDVIFTVYFGSSDSIADAEAAVSKLVDDPKYQSLTAIQNNRVYAISLGEMYCSGTRTLDGINRLAEGIYPSMSE